MTFSASLLRAVLRLWDSNVASLTSASRAIALASKVTTPTFDIVGLVKAADTDAAAAIATAEKERREAIRKAEARAAELVAAARESAQKERTERLAMAQIEAAKILERATREADAAAKKVEASAKRRVPLAVDLLVRLLRERWRLTE